MNASSANSMISTLLSDLGSVLTTSIPIALVVFAGLIGLGVVLAILADLLGIRKKRPPYVYGAPDKYNFPDRF